MSIQNEAITIQAVTRAKVMQLLGLTDAQHAEYIMAYGYAYLRHHLGENLMGKSLSKQALFWGWWRNHWHSIDAEFVKYAKFLTDEDRGETYDKLHGLETFGFKPPRPVMRDAFKKIEYQPVIIHQL